MEFILRSEEPQVFFHGGNIKREILFNGKKAKTYIINKLGNSFSLIFNIKESNIKIPNWVYVYFKIFIKLLKNRNSNGNLCKFMRIFRPSNDAFFWEHNTSLIEMVSKSGLDISSDIWHLLQITPQDLKKVPKIYRFDPYSEYKEDIVSIKSIKGILLTENFYLNYPKVKELYEITKNFCIKKYTINKYNDIYSFFDNEIYKELIYKYNYPVKRLFQYLSEEIIWQGIKPLVYISEQGYLSFNYEGSQILRDYAKMSYDVKNSFNFDKYPKYLKTYHDIIMMNYNAKLDEIKIRKFQEVISEDAFNKFASFKTKDYGVYIPQKPEDIIKEGVSLHHCVASYLDDFIDKSTQILFIRKNKVKDESLLTMQITDNQIIQVKGLSNRGPYNEEQIFINDFAKKFSLEIA